MARHFELAEYDRRIEATKKAMADRGLDGLILFRQESLYYLTGFDTFGYVFFQVAVLTADGRMALITRAPDLRQAQHTSTFKDIRVWVDREDATPVDDLKQLMTEFGLQGGQIGVEWDAYGLTAKLGRQVATGLAGFCATEEASDLVSRLRVVKSTAELGFVRRAAQLADRAYEAMLATTRPGAFEGDILASMHAAIFRGDGDPPANPFIIGSDRDALLCRYVSGRRHLHHDDQMTLEWAASFRHYHAAMMRTVAIGRATERHKELHKVAVDAWDAALGALKPGRPIGEVFDAYARVCDDAGMAAHRMNACGYSLGTTFQPNWMDWPMFYRGNPVVAEPGMVFFPHMILMDSESGTAMCPGQTVIVNADGPEVLSHHALDLAVL